MNILSAIKIILLTGLIFFISTPSYSQRNQESDRSNLSITDTASKPAATDAEITGAVKDLISKSKTLSKLKVHVSTSGGVVSLRGNVNSNTQATLLVENAESVNGVRNVDTSGLTVKGSEHPLDDAMTTAKIKGLLVREKLFGERDVAAVNTSVETKDGIVYLSGVVDNQDQINNAIEIIKQNVPEVKKIEYNVKKAAASDDNV